MRQRGWSLGTRPTREPRTLPRAGGGWQRRPRLGTRGQHRAMGTVVRAGRLRAEASAKSAHVPLPRCHFCLQGHSHVTFPRITGLPPHQPLVLHSSAPAHCLESLKCILNKSSSNSCAISLINVHEILRRAALQSWLRGALGPTGPKPLVFYAINPTAMSGVSVTEGAEGHIPAERCPRALRARAGLEMSQTLSLCSHPVSPLHGLGPCPGAFPVQSHLCQTGTVDGARLDPHQGGCPAEGRRTASQRCPGDRAREQRSPAGSTRQGRAISIVPASGTY